MIDILKKIIELQKLGRESVLITVVDKKGYGPADTHFKMLITDTEERLGTVGGGAIEKIAVETAGELLIKKSNLLKTYSLTDSHDLIDEEATGMICGGSLTLFYEYLGNPETVIIFGGGHVGSALAYHLTKLNLKVVIIDNRSDINNNIKGSTLVKVNDFTEGVEREIIPDTAWIVIVTYSHEEDFRILKSLYEKEINAKYIGLIGSRSKKEQTLARLKSELGAKFKPEILYCPIGLNIGGKTPHDVAISVAAEIQALRNGTDNIRHMRDST